MDENQQLPEGESFSNDPEENLRMENEFLKLKIMAESGGVFGEDKSDIPPDIINEWLKNVIEYEKNYAHASEMKVKDILKAPSFKKEEDLDDQSFLKAWEQLCELLESHNLNVDFIRPRNDRFKYNFIVGELFEHETTFIPSPGMVTNFIYEEFHPDHELDITNRTNDFFRGFFKRSLPQFASHYLEDELIRPDGTKQALSELVKEFELLYEEVPAFENTSFEIVEIDFQLSLQSEREDGTDGMMGFSEGAVKYDMIFRNGERKEIDGTFKLYMNCRFGWWNIYYFYLAGFNNFSEWEG